jgi:hypothetical protein
MERPGSWVPPKQYGQESGTFEREPVKPKPYGQDAGQVRPMRKEPDPLPRSLIAGVGQNAAVTESVVVNRMVKKSTGGVDADVDSLLGKFG